MQPFARPRLTLSKAKPEDTPQGDAPTSRGAEAPKSKKARKELSEDEGKLHNPSKPMTT